MTLPNIPYAGQVIVANSGTKPSWEYRYVFGSGSSQSINNAATTSGNDDTTSSSFVLMAGTGAIISLIFNKQFSARETKLYVEMSASMKLVSAGTSTRADIGVRVNETDFQIGQGFLNPTDTHFEISSFDHIEGLESGSYTIQAVWKRGNGTATLRRDTGDWLSLLVEEVPL